MRGGLCVTDDAGLCGMDRHGLFDVLSVFPLLPCGFLYGLFEVLSVFRCYLVGSFLPCDQLGALLGRRSPTQQAVIFLDEPLNNGRTASDHTPAV